MPCPQVTTVHPGHLIGDMSVFGTMRCRTATVRAESDVVAYRLRRSHFLRLCPPAQLEVCVRTGELSQGAGVLGRVRWEHE